MQCFANKHHLETTYLFLWPASCACSFNASFSAFNLSIVAFSESTKNFFRSRDFLALTRFLSLRLIFRRSRSSPSSSALSSSDSSDSFLGLDLARPRARVAVLDFAAAFLAAGGFEREAALVDVEGALRFRFGFSFFNEGPTFTAAPQAPVSLSLTSWRYSFRHRLSVECSIASRSSRSDATQIVSPSSSLHKQVGIQVKPQAQ